MNAPAVCQNPGCRNGSSYNAQVIEYAGTGRPPRFCSAACKQQDYRERRDIAAREAARQERVRADEAYMRRLVTEVERGLVNVKMSTTQRKAVATGIANAVARVQRTLPGLS